MAALSSSRNTPEMADFGRMQIYPVEANTTIYLGAMVALNANGNAVPASSASGLKIVGRAERLYNGLPGQDAINTSSAMIPGTNQPAGAAGAISIVCRRGVFMYAVNDGSLAQAQVGALCFAVDDNSVSASDGSGATAVSGESHTFPASTSAQVITVGHENISKLVVTSSPPGTTYVEGKDYVVDYQAGMIMLPPSGGAIAAASTVLVSYNWGAPTRSVAGTVVNLDPSGQVWVDFWHQAALAA
ncbi:MAG TPA: hypothetical protein VFB33_05500 [Candidatus Binataceae bacterium]|nr:hypothetical protein [Candidatus Binataceae bacterium]